MVRSVSVTTEMLLLHRLVTDWRPLAGRVFIYLATISTVAPSYRSVLGSETDPRDKRWATFHCLAGAYKRHSWDVRKGAWIFSPRNALNRSLTSHQTVRNQHRLQQARSSQQETVRITEEYYYTGNSGQQIIILILVQSSSKQHFDVRQRIFLIVHILHFLDQQRTVLPWPSWCNVQSHKIWKKMLTLLLYGPSEKQTFFVKLIPLKRSWQKGVESMSCSFLKIGTCLNYD